MSEPSLFDLLKTDLAVEPGTFATWPPGELYRAECGCIVNLRPDDTTRVIWCQTTSCLLSMRTVTRDLINASTIIQVGS